MSSSNSAKNKIIAAINHLENAERQIASLPRIYYRDETTREVIRMTTSQLRVLADRIRSQLQLSNPDPHNNVAAGR